MKTTTRCIVFLAVFAFLVSTGTALIAEERTTTHTVVREGTVYKVFGNVLILRIPGEGYKKFVVPSDFTIESGGRELTIRDLEPGMMLARVDVVHFAEGEKTMTVEQVQSYEPDSDEVAAAVVVAEVVEEPTPEPTPEPAPEPAPQVLPKTASPLPLIAMVGLLLIGVAVGLILFRKMRG